MNAVPRPDDAKSLMTAIDQMLEWCLEHADNMAGPFEHARLIEAKPAGTCALSTFDKPKHSYRGSRC